MRSSIVSGRVGSQLIFAAVVVCGAIAGWEAWSDDAPAENEPPEMPLALTDVARIFKQDKAFLQRMNEIKAEIEVFEGRVKSLQAEIDKLQPKEISSDAPSGIPADNRVKAAQMQAALRAEVEAHRQRFLQEETNTYYDRNEALEAAVEKIAVSRNIAVVFRYNSEPMNRADRNSVLQGVNRAVIYSRVRDLTDEVIELLNAEKL
jgi:hypothetical protein